MNLLPGNFYLDDLFDDFTPMHRMPKMDFMKCDIYEKDGIVHIEMDAPEVEFLKWYSYNLDAHEFGFATPNFESWLKGCPRVSSETFNKLQGLKNDLDDAIKSEKQKISEF
jgi:hypothetical protein